MRVFTHQESAVFLKGTLFTGLVVLLSVIYSFGCGGSSSVPASGDVTLSVLSASNTEIEAIGTTGVNPTLLEIEFLEAMDDLSVTTAGNVTFVCGGLTAVIHVTKSETAENTYLVAVDDAWKYGKMDCVLTITTNVKTANGVPLPAIETYAFQNACSVSDDFNVRTVSDSGDCWNVDTSGGPTITTWAGISDIVSFDESDSSLNVDFTGHEGEVISFSKTVSVSSDFEIEVYVKATSGMTKGKNSSVLVFLDHKGGNPDASYWISISDTGYGANPNCYITGVNRTPDPDTRSGYLTPCAEATGYYLKLAKSGDTFLRQYKAEGGEYANIPYGSGPEWSDLGMTGDDLTLGVSFDSGEGSPAETAQVGYVKVTGITASGQY